MLPAEEDVASPSASPTPESMQSQQVVDENCLDFTGYGMSMAVLWQKF